MTEFHARYGGYGVMIYWHVERGRLCVYSQLKSCSSSEVAAMIEGLLRHGTDAEIEANYTDTHSASLVGFAFTELLGFKFLPRLKNIGAIQLYSPDVIQAASPKLEKVLKKRPIDGDLIARNYDQMVKYATALRLRTAETNQVLRRFTKGGGPKHPRLPRPGRTRQGRADHLRLRLPRRRAAPARDKQRPAGRRELELRQ
jgi:TnpA family transposase